MSKNQRDVVGGIWGLFRVLLGFVPLVLIFVFGQYSLLIIYAIVGIIVFSITRYLKLSTAKNWLTDILVSILIWPVMLFLWKEFFKPERRTLLDEFNSIVDKNPALKLQRDYFSAMNKNGTTEDEIPNSIGRFGFDVTNPIPTNNIFGSYAYLGRLRDKNGNQITYNRLGSTSAENVANPIDEYDILDAKGNVLGTIYISPYQKNISKKASEGFSLK